MKLRCFWAGSSIVISSDSPPCIFVTLFSGVTAFKCSVSARGNSSHCFFLLTYYKTILDFVLLKAVRWCMIR